MIVSVIDCPRLGDAIDGASPGLYLKDLIDCCGIPVQYELTQDIRTFRAAIERSLFRSVSLEKWPVIHLDGHGSAEGIGLSDGTLVTWGQLAAILEPTLEAYDGAAILCISTCEGLFGARMALIEALDASFLAVVGSRQTIRMKDAAHAYLAFVSHLAHGSDPHACLSAMNAVYGEPVFEIIAGRARFLRDSDEGSRA